MYLKNKTKPVVLYKLCASRISFDFKNYQIIYLYFSLIKIENINKYNYVVVYLHYSMIFYYIYYYLRVLLDIGFCCTLLSSSLSIKLIVKLEVFSLLKQIQIIYIYI